MLEVIQLLNKLGERSQRYSTSYYIRTLDKDEPIPQFGHGIPNSYLINREWVWLAVSNKTFEPVAILFAAPTLNFATLLRIYATKDSPRMVMLSLLRKALDDINKRGYTHFAVFLSQQQPYDVKLSRLIKRVGGDTVGDACRVWHCKTDVTGW